MNELKNVARVHEYIFTLENQKHNLQHNLINKEKNKK